MARKSSGKKTGNQRRKSRRSRISQLVGRLVVLSAWIGGLALLVLVPVMIFYSVQAGKFDLDQVSDMPPAITVYDSDGNVISTLRGSSHRIAARDDLPEFLVNALLAREDTNFYHHGGVDWKGIARATVRNIRDMSFTQGASTLTMQLAKNTYEIRAKSLNRKFLEIALTRRIEDRFTKDEILVYYLNRVYFGAGAYGIGDAAYRFFSRDVADLTPSQCAALVGIIRGPAIFNPLADPQAAIHQRNQVLNRMVAAGFIDEARADKVRATSLDIAEGTLAHGETRYDQQAIRRHLDALVRTPDLARSGLIAHSTLDPTEQKRLDDACSTVIASIEQENLSLRGKIQCAGVVMQPQTGEILALTGGRDFSTSQTNRALDGRLTIGPLIEPFLQAIAFDHGTTPITGQPVATGRATGRSHVATMLPIFGISGEGFAGDDLFRGFQTISCLEMAKALSIFATGGLYPRHVLIERITSPSGQILLQQSPSARQIITAQAAAFAQKFFGTANEGPRTGVFHARNERDLWIVSLHAKRMTTIWFGCDIPTPFRIKSEANLRKKFAAS